jgi:hypothetical protein
MHTLAFPPDDGPVDPEWWAPLEAVARAITHEHRYRFFDLSDFMLMAKVVRRNPRPDVFLYKHCHTRHYLNLDEAGHAYRYVPPRELFGGSGRYLKHRSLRVALDGLELWALPWMNPGLAEHRHGLSWEDRWRLDPDCDAAGDDRDGWRGRGDRHLRIV